LAKNVAPMSGGLLGPYLEKGEWQIQGSFNRYTSYEPFTESTVQEGAIAADAGPKTGGGSLNFQGAYALTRQINFTADVPVGLYTYWNYPLGGKRYEMKTHGLGDVVLGGRFWLLNTEKNTKQNLALQLALRLPTGDSNYQVPYPNGLGQDIKLRAAKSDAQPGSGASGLRLAAQGFRRFGHFAVYGNALYLFSLKEHNDTYSILSTLNPGGPAAVPANMRFNAVPDSYLFNAGISAPVPHLKKLSLSLGSQIAGVPTFNVMTDSEGFRQPGYLVTINPSLSLNMKVASYFIGVPVRVYGYIGQDFSGAQQTANLNKTSLQFGVNFHLGGKKPTK
jgi:hypothetical protein